MNVTKLIVNDDELWEAVLARSPRTDFVYAVTSTGIFCRSNCPSRRPGRARVHFYETPAQARAGGFRPCRRCVPDQEAPAVTLVRAACRVIEAADRPPTLLELGRAVGCSPFHLQRTFKQITGLTPRQWGASHRRDRFRRELRGGESVTEAVYAAGFRSTSRLYEGAAGRLGMAPATYRRGGQGAEVRATIVASPLGRLLVAATDAGVCFVALGDDDTALMTALRTEYPRAQVRPDGGTLAGWAEAVVRYLNDPATDLQLPLDLQATAFQWRVWEALRAIPAGEIRTYGAIAADLGLPGAARAVGSACARNPVSLLIPCHRAVRTDGALGGYRWGLERKRALLDGERPDPTPA